MNGKQILFFGTKEDLQPIIKELESKADIKYFLMGLFDESKEKGYNSIDEVQDWGSPPFGDWNKDIRLMMIPQELNLVIRTVPQKKGGIKYAIDPLENQTSVCFQFGGVVKEGVLLAGTCGTAFLNDFSLNIFKMFSVSLKKHFKKIGSFYVGRIAEEKLNEGWRLVTNEKSPRTYDLPGCP